LAARITVQAVHQLSALRTIESSHFTTETTTTTPTPTAHPMIGSVDHVSILSLSPQKQQLLHEDSTLISKDEWMNAIATESSSHVSWNQPEEPTLVTGWVARTVGHALDTEADVSVLWYGHADPNRRPLAWVRKHHTRFFTTGGLIPITTTTPAAAATTTTTTSVSREQATVGAPDHFVENYNIQVATSDRTVAQSLTRWVRSTNGGILPHVEALTLPYGSTMDGIPLYEVACNLLDPTVTSTIDIDQQVQAWLDATSNNSEASTEQQQGRLPTIVRSYRVGTTVEQCLEALENTQTRKGEAEHNQRVRAGLESFFLTTSTEQVSS
jgi:hypothetical protein